MILSIIKMVMVQNRCHNWKERDEISKNVNLKATDTELCEKFYNDFNT